MFKKYLFFFFIILISLIPLGDLFNTGLPITHDGLDHVIRLANFYQNLSEGNIIPRWAANVNYGYGHPFPIFFYPLPYYIGSLFHFLGFSLINSTKLVFGVTYILSGVAMFIWIREFLGRSAALIASSLYIFAPYRFVDLYVRGAIGEHVAFVFLPIILYFLLKFSKEHSFFYIVCSGLLLAGLILTHNAISLMFIPLIILYGIYLFWQSEKKVKFIIYYLIFIIFGFLLSAFFWIPAFFESKYTLVNIVTGGKEYTSSFVGLKSMLYDSWSYGGTGELSVQIGLIQIAIIIGLVLWLFWFGRKRNRYFIFTVSILGILAITIFLMTEQSAFVWENVILLHKFQFPWRFLTVVVFLTAVLGGLFFIKISKQFQFLVFCAILIAVLLLNKDYWHAKDYLLKNDNFFTAVQRTTTNDTGESSPIWSTRFMEAAPKARIEIVNGEEEVKELERSITKHSYQVETEKMIRIRENTLYFPGWVVLVDGVETEIEFQDPSNRGLITFYVNKGNHIVNVLYKETKIRLFSNAISFISLIISIVLIMFQLTKRRMYNKK